MLNREFGELFLQSVDNPGKYGVHLLFNDYWRFMAPHVREKLVAWLYAEPQTRRWIEERWYPQPYAFDSLGALPQGTLGNAYYRHIVDNGLNKEIASGYRKYHDQLEASGVLANMPDEIKYTVLRGFQVHDLLHMATGFDTSPLGEIALQAFGVAQTGSIYNAMWLAVTNARAAFLDPNANPALMDAICEGWMLGRAVATDLVTVKWELMFDRQVSDIRQQFGIPEHRMMLQLAA